MPEKTKLAMPRQLRVWVAPKAAEPTIFAAKELARVLSQALADSVSLKRTAPLGEYSLALGLSGKPAPYRGAPPADGFIIAPTAESVAVVGSTGPGIMRGVCRMLEQLGAHFSLDAAWSVPQLSGRFPWSLAAERFEPAFARRAFVSDIMTFHYEEPKKFKLHLGDDRRFITWMAWQGMNRFFYIRHARDSRARIDELAPALRECGIGPEYGGHILQLLLERERFARTPDFFPLGTDGLRNPQGNLCVSNPSALEIVCRNALSYVCDYPENQLFHVWGADVWEGAWCCCSRCARLSPQLQYMTVVNAIARRVCTLNDQLEVAYLAYHDTIEPDPRLRPLANVCFEWAPRERCYCHAIDDARCATNRRYWDALRRYMDLFSGRGHVFEYYADALLFGGLSFATPEVIARDLGAYRALGLKGVSCLTFGAFSVLAYPANLIAFAQSSRACTPKPWYTAVAAERHPKCERQMAKAYRLIAAASRRVLSYGDVIRVDKIPAKLAPFKRAALRAAAREVEHAIEAAQRAKASNSAKLHSDELALWRYGALTLRALSDYLSVFSEGRRKNLLRARHAVDDLEAAFSHVRNIRLQAKGVWGEADLESFHQRWLAALRRRLERLQ
jgi:hypothetical protein